MSLDLNDLQIFVQVVEHGGFTAASRALNLPKQTLSKRLAELERRAGVRLIQRTTRSFTVTELGQELYRHAAAMVIEAKAAEDVIFGRLAEPSGTVRVSASIPTAQQSLAPLLPRIAKTYPKIRLVLHASDMFVDVVQDGYDLAVRDHLRPLPDSGLVQRRIGTETFWLVATPGYLADQQPAQTPADLEPMDGLYAAQGEKGWTLTKGHETAKASPQPRYYANESIGLLQAALAGLGIACLPSTLCEEAMRAGSLMRVLPDWSAGKVFTTLLMPHRRGLLPSVRVVADLLIEQLSGEKMPPTVTQAF